MEFQTQKTVFKSVDERTKYIFKNLDIFKTYTREEVGTGDTYKYTIAEQNFVNSVILDSSRVIINNTVFFTPMLHAIDEIFTQFFNLNPPFITRYKNNIEKYYKLTVLNHIEYTYGSRWAEYNQFDNIIKILLKRPDSKRGVIAIYTPYDTADSRIDVPCTLFYNFILRDSELDMYVSFRSHDLYAGYKTDYVLSKFVLNYIARMLELLGHFLVRPGKIYFHEASLHYYPKAVKNSPEQILKNFTGNDTMFQPFTETQYLSSKELLQDMLNLKLSEEASYAKSFSRSQELIESIQDSYLRDIAKYLYNLQSQEKLLYGSKLNLH
jgi:thymidylate synthase